MELTPQTVPPSPPSRSRRRRLIVGMIVLVTLCGVASVAAGTALLLRARADARADRAAPPPVVGLAPGAATETFPDGGAPAPEEGTQVEPPATRAADDGLPGRLVYITTDRQVATVNPDGSDGRQLTDGERNYQFPAWAPDGNQIATIGGDGRGSGVFVLPDREAAAGSSEPVYFSPTQAPIYLYWAPDSRQVSLLANHPSGLALFLAPAAGGEARLLATGQPFYWAWNPDGETIFVHSGGSQAGARLALLDPIAGAFGDDIASPGSFQSPGFSASGARLAYVEEEENGERWLTIRQPGDGEADSAAGQPEARLPHTGSVALSWSPSEEKLAFISPTFGESQMYGPLRLYDAALQDTVTLSAQTVVAFFWSPDGQHIAYLTVHGRETIEARGPGTAPTKGRTARMAAQSNGMPRLDLWIVDAATGRQGFLASFDPTPLFLSQFLPFFDQYALSHRLWSPDSRALVLPTRVDGASQITLFTLEGDEPRAIVPGEMAFWSHD